MRRRSFGISVTPYAADYPALVGQVLAAERHGLELVVLPGISAATGNGG